MTKRDNVVIAELAHTCLACPSQWEGRLVDGRPVYIRYRWSTLSVSLGATGKELFAEHLPGSDGYIGFLNLSDVLTHTGLQLADGIVVAERW